ncbi:hypothetical protein HMPREF1547_01084 [Blautia sp. KLE 1732]|nr:hypothetical protein HMPREF1547_01084 [Blautia sp. KLE 1732]
MCSCISCFFLCVLFPYRKDILHFTINRSCIFCNPYLTPQ